MSLERLHEEIRGEIEGFERAAYCGDSSSSECRIEPDCWEDYYRRWLEHGRPRKVPAAGFRATPSDGMSAKDREMLDYVEGVLATHCPPEHRDHVAPGGLSLKRPPAPGSD